MIINLTTNAGSLPPVPREKELEKKLKELGSDPDINEVMRVVENHMREEANRYQEYHLTGGGVGVYDTIKKEWSSYSPPVCGCKLRLRST